MALEHLLYYNLAPPILCRLHIANKLITIEILHRYNIQNRFKSNGHSSLTVLVVNCKFDIIIYRTLCNYMT